MQNLRCVVCLSQKCPFAAGVCLVLSISPSESLSLSLSLARYYSQCMFQHTGQELADNLKVCMTAALKNYHEINGRLPERILVYRDGVGDGQVSICVLKSCE